MFSYHISLTDDDFITFNTYHLLNSPAGKRSVFIYRWFVPILSALMVILTALVEQDPAMFIIKITFIVIVTIIWLFQVKKLFIRGIKTQVKQTRKTGKLPYFPEADLVFDEYVIRETHSVGMSEIRYEALEKVAVTSDALYLYFSTAQAFILPTTYLATEVEKQQLIDFLVQKNPGIVIVR